MLFLITNNGTIARVFLLKLSDGGFGPFAKCVRVHMSVCAHGHMCARVRADRVIMRSWSADTVSVKKDSFYI